MSLYIGNALNKTTWCKWVLIFKIIQIKTRVSHPYSSVVMVHVTERMKMDK